MDDLTVTTTVPGCKWIRQGLEKLIGWARNHQTNSKLTKYSLNILEKVKVVDKLCFSVGVHGNTITEKAVTSLGMAFNCSLKNTAFVQATIR